MIPGAQIITEIELECKCKSKIKDPLEEKKTNLSS
jgi:hypothetical protein